MKKPPAQLWLAVAPAENKTSSTIVGEIVMIVKEAIAALEELREVVGPDASVHVAEDGESFCSPAESDHERTRRKKLSISMFNHFPEHLAECVDAVAKLRGDLRELIKANKSLYESQKFNGVGMQLLFADEAADSVYSQLVSAASEANRELDYRPATEPKTDNDRAMMIVRELEKVLADVRLMLTGFSGDNFIFHGGKDSQTLVKNLGSAALEIIRAAHHIGESTDQGWGNWDGFRTPGAKIRAMIE